MFVYHPSRDDKDKDKDKDKKGKGKAKLRIEPALPKSRDVQPKKPAASKTSSKAAGKTGVKGGKTSSGAGSKKAEGKEAQSSGLPLSSPDLSYGVPSSPLLPRLVVTPEEAPPPPFHTHPMQHYQPLPEYALLPPTQSFDLRPVSFAVSEIASTIFEYEPKVEEPPKRPTGAKHVEDNVIYDRVSRKLDTLITSLAEGATGLASDALLIADEPESTLRGGWGFPRRSAPRPSVTESTSKGTDYFSKVNIYANSRLPLNLPPLKLYLPAYPLICLAAQFSQRVYHKPTGKERETHIEPDWRAGTKAMVIKSVPVDHMNAVVFAIRGTQTFLDWTVNIRSNPITPAGFLDDAGNMCHAGFLNVARKMISPVAARLRSILEEDPSRRNSSLIITGHSAGGAIAALLFAHMSSQQTRSELTVLRERFRRVHCITFGIPPLSLLPLTKPDSERWRKSLFLAFINEGDPVPRADKAYVRSLVDLYLTPSPNNVLVKVPTGDATPMSKSIFKARPRTRRTKSAPSAPAPTWLVPTGTLSNAGRLVILRQALGGAESDVRAFVSDDQQLRGVMYGDPTAHAMKLYSTRVEQLATMAVTARAWNGVDE